MRTGARALGAFARILLPLTLPGLAATSLYAFVVAWNDYQYALILTSSTRAKTIQMGLAAQGAGSSACPDPMRRFLT